MKKLLAINLITFGMLIASGYTTSTYAEATPDFYTPDNVTFSSVYSWAWDESEISMYHDEDEDEEDVETIIYDGQIEVDIDKDYLEWELKSPGDYMNKWTTIKAVAMGTASSSLRITVSECDHMKRIDIPDETTLTTYYAIVDVGEQKQSKDLFITAPEFNGNLPETPIKSINGSPITYEKDLWARVVVDPINPHGIYEDVFYLTFGLVP